jgi:hypothetical protein
VGVSTLIGIQSIYKNCGLAAESNLDIAIWRLTCQKGEHPALSDPVLVIGSITFMGPAGS